MKVEAIQTARDQGILAEDLRVERGRFSPSERPGRGIVFDRDGLRRYAAGVAAVEERS